MKRYILTAAAAVGVTLILTACSRNAGADLLNNTADKPTDTQTQNQIEIQMENPKDIPKENGTLTEQGSDSASNYNIPNDNISESEEKPEAETKMKMNVQIGDYNFTATLENNAAVEELLDMMKEGPVTIQMDDYSGFEKVGSLGRSLTASNSQTTTVAGDIVLYNGNNIVMFYGSNSWSYTRIGKIDDLSDWEKALGSGSITAVFTLADMTQ